VKYDLTTRASVEAAFNCIWNKTKHKKLRKDKKLWIIFGLIF